MSIDVQEHVRQFLGKLLNNPAAINNIDLDVAVIPSHTDQVIFLTIADVVFNGSGNVLTGVVEALGDKLAEVGGAAYLLRLYREAQTSIAPTYEAQELTKAFQEQQARQAIATVVAGAEAGADPLTLLTDALERLKALDGSLAKPIFQVMTAAELSAANIQTTYIVDGLLVEGQPCIVAAVKKCLKTTIVPIDMGLSVASGTMVLGKFVVPESQTVLVFSGESGLSTLKETATRVAASKGLLLRDIKRFLISTDIPRFNNPEHVLTLARLLRKHGVKVVIIDPAYLAMSGDDAGNLFTQGAVLLEISKVCQDAGATLLLVHHTKKGGRQDPFAPPELDDIAWAGFQEFARQWILLGRREKYQPGTGEHRLWLSAGGSAGHSSLWGVDVNEGCYIAGEPRKYEVSVVQPHEAHKAAERTQDDAKRRRERDKTEEAKQQIKKRLKRGPATKTDIKEGTGLVSAVLGRALTELVDQGEVETTDIRKAGRLKPYEGYQLTAEAECAEERRDAFTDALAAYNASA